MPNGFGSVVSGPSEDVLAIRAAVDHPAIHEKLIKVTPHVTHSGRIRGAQVDQQNALAHAIFKKAATRSAALRPDMMESLSETPSR